jgi:hydroxymethylbilane synthase
MRLSESTLILGTRGSDLALAQSRMVREALVTAHPGLAVELTTITTTGDARTSMPLHEPTAEGAGLFTKQLEEALLKGDIDLAVHSLKDLPVDTPKGLTIAAILERAPVDDLLVMRDSGGISELPVGASVGSSSPRRSLLLKAHRPDLNLIPIRGNVPTRLAKVAAGGAYDATILAAAGLGRLGHDISAGSLMIEKTVLWMEALDWMLPAPGQGAIAVECRQGDEAERLLSVLNHPSTSRCVEAERLVLRHLGGGCHLALGALATESPEGMSMKAVFIPNPEAAPIMAEAIAASPAEVSRMIVDQLLS